MLIDPNDIDPEDRIRALVDEATRRGLPLPEKIQRKILEEEARRRGLLRWRSFGEFVRHMHPSFLQHDYIRRQIKVAEAVLAGQIRRLLVMEPTQYGKSELWSRLFPAYYLLTFPSRTVALASYGAELAWNHCGGARDYYHEAGGQFKEGSLRGQQKHWKTVRRMGQSGGMWAAGIRGPGLGFGYHLGIVDDPVDPEMARSLSYKGLFPRWWATKWIRGQRPRVNAMIFIMQRLETDDPVNWLLEREETSAEEKWHILCMDEIHSKEAFWKGKGVMGFPRSCTVEPDPRQVGEVLAPGWRSPDEVAKIQAQTGTVVTSAMRQQRPARPTGDFWKAAWFEGRVFDALPPDAHNGGWDLDTAYTKDPDNSASAGILSYRGAGKKDECKIYIVDMFLEWFEFPELIKHLRLLKGPFYVEQKASGKSVVQQLKAYQIIASEVKVLGGKLERASAAQPVAATAGVYISKLVYEKLLAGEQGLLRITAETLLEEKGGLDLNDAFVQSLWRHRDIASAKKKVRVGG